MMKRLFLLLGVVCFAMFVIALPVFAANEAYSGQSVTLEKNETVNGNYFASGKSVNVEGSVTNDAYVAGGNVLVDGTIANDLLVAGGTVTIHGTINHDLRVAGGQVVISGTVGGNVTVIGGNVTVEDTGKIAGSLVAGGGQVTLYGPVGQSVVVGGGQVTIGSSIGGDVWASGQVTVNNNASIEGSLTYLSKNTATIDPQAHITGKVNHTVPPKPSPEPHIAVGAFLAGLSFILSLASFITAFLLGLLLLNFAPIYSGHVTNVILQRPWWSLLIGFLTVIIVPILIVFLLALLIGIPFAILLAIALFLFEYFAKIFVSWAIGLFILKRITKNETHPAWVLLLGLVVYYLILLIPVIGGIFWIFATLIGIGALVISKRDYYIDLRQNKFI